jgi:hypothetical protein
MSGERKCNVSDIRTLTSRWHRDELGAERKAARREMPENVSTDSRHYPQVRGASLKAVNASRECPA